MTGKCEICGAELTISDMPHHSEIPERDQTGGVIISCLNCREGKTKQFKFNGLEVLEKTAKPFGQNSAHIGVPKGWIGCRVAIVRLDEIGMIAAMHNECECYKD